MVSSQKVMASQKVSFLRIKNVCIINLSVSFYDKLMQFKLKRTNIFFGNHHNFVRKLLIKKRQT